MSDFHYTALNHSGGQIHGVIQAPDERSARKKLKADGIFVTSLHDKKEHQNAALDSDVITAISQLKPITAMQKVFFFRQLAVLIRSGMSVTESLHIIERLLKGKFKHVVASLNKQVISGNSLSKSLSDYPKVFSEIMVHMIRSAEATGELDVVCERIASHLEQRAEMKRQTVITMLYPFITLLFAVGLFVFLAIVVIPKFATFIQNSGKVLPPTTQALLDTSAFLQSWGMVIGIAFLALLFLLVYLYENTNARLTMDRFFLKIPVLGYVIHISAMSQIGWGLSVLLKSGLTVVEALEITKNLIHNRCISDAVHDAREQILHGNNLEDSLDSRYISPLVQQMASVGEKSGGLDEVMREAGNFFEETLKAKSKVLASLIEPIAILLIGGMVGFVYVAFFSAVFSISGG